MKKSLSKILTIVFVGVLSLTLVLNTNPFANIMATEENTKEEVETTEEEVETVEEEPADGAVIDTAAPKDSHRGVQAAFKSLAAGMSSRAALARDQWTGYVTKVFPDWQASVNIMDPLLETNSNTSIIDSKWTTYDAQANGGLPNSYWRGKVNNPTFYPVEPLYGARVRESSLAVDYGRSPLNYNASWSIKMKMKLPVKNGAFLNQVEMASYISETGDDFTYMTPRFTLGTDEGLYPGQSFVYAAIGQNQNVFVDGKQLLLFPKGYFDTEREVELKNVYDEKTNSYLFSLHVGGESITYDSKKIDAAFANLTGMRIGRDFYVKSETRWGKVPTIGANNAVENSTLSALYPVDAETYITFDDTSLTYENYNPLFESIVWKDAKGNTLDENSKVNVGDKLTVTASLKNDIVVGDQIYSRLFADAAKIKGITTDLASRGTQFILSNKSMPLVINTEVQPGTVGTHVEIGLKSIDSFFQRELSKDSKGPLVVRDVDQKSEVKVMELARDANGSVLKDGANFKFVEADDQNMLTQDSFLKVEGTFTNTRLSENVNLKWKLDSSSALGFDFTNIRNLVLSNGSGSAADLVSATGVSFNLPMNNGTATYSFVVPVKQSAVGKPFNVDEQKLKYTYDSSYTIAGVVKTDSWSDEEIVSNTTLRPIKDIDMELTTSDVSLERGQAFELLKESDSLLTFTGSNGGSTDWGKLRVLHQGVAADWANFGLTTNSEANGIVGPFIPDGTTMKTTVSYNEVLQLNGKVYYTRKGGALEETPRTKTKEINLTVNGGVISPEGFVDIPSFVGLKDSNGIDSKHAGEKATVKLKDNAPTGVDFEISGDTDFLVSDTKESYVVSLYHEDKVEMSQTNKKASVGTLNDANKSKVVWYNTPIDVKKVGSYLGTMTFYIKVN